MEQWIVFATLAGALALFIHGRIRYDVVALVALLVVAIAGLVPEASIFAGFGHPAVITVAAVLVISRGLLNAGVVDLIARWMTKAGQNPVRQLAALMLAVTAASAFMNNVGALALLMPVAIRMARKGGHSPSILLMPLAFGSLLGGLTTLIGTPPNIIIAAFRNDVKGLPFGMFDFTPVGLGVALAGGLFIVLLGWRLVPQRAPKGGSGDLFAVEEYSTELLVPEDSPLAGRALYDLKQVADADVVVMMLIRDKRRRVAPSGMDRVRAGDVLVVEADPEDLKEFMDAAGLELAGSEKIETDEAGSNDVSLMEVVVTPDAPIVNQTARSLNMRWRYGLNLLAVARRGARLRRRLGRIRFQPGDILLLQGPENSLRRALPELGCLPLAERDLQLGKPRRLLLSVGLFGAALALATAGLLSIQLALLGAAVLMVLAGLLSLKEVYASIDWPIIVLLGAMIPVGEALELTGGAQTIAGGLLALGQQLPPAVTLGMVMVATMFLSDLVNNAAAAVLMAPIAINVAAGLGVNADPFLMAVAIGASCAFLTPIGHQSNTLVMGPGGYHFGDYWRMGLLLELIILAVGLPLLLLFWPL